MRRDPKMLEQLGGIERARDLVEKKQFAEARELLETLRGEARGRRSAHVAWNLAIVCDYLGDLEMAVSYLEEALAADPLAVPFHRSFDIVTSRIRDVLTADDRQAADPSTPRLYKLLTGSGEANVACHVAMARYHAATGNPAAAIRLLEAVTTLEPTDRTAWMALAEVARAAGEVELASRAQVEAASLQDGVPIPFAVPGRAEG